MEAVVSTMRPVPPTMPPSNSIAIATTQTPTATAIREDDGDGARKPFIAAEA
jgi:hypothetical protein